MAISSLPPGPLFFLLWLSLMGHLPLEVSGPPSPAPRSTAALYLPETAPLVISVTDPATLAYHVSQTQSWKLLLQSPLKDQLSEGMGKLWTRMHTEIGFQFEDLKPLIAGPMTLALLETPGESDMAPPRLALIIELPPGASEKVWQTFALKLFPQAGQQGLIVEPVGEGEKAYTRLKSADGDVLGALSVTKERLLLVSREADLETLSAPAAKPLAKQSVYASYEAERAKADVTIDVTSEILMQTILRETAYDLRQLLMWGMKDSGGLHYNATATADGFVERVHLRMGPGSQFEKYGTPAAGLKMRVPSQLQPQASLVWNVLLASPEALFADWRRDGKFSDGEMDSFKQSTGLDFQKDVVDQLTGEFAIMVELPTISPDMFENPALLLGLLGETKASLFFGVKDEKRAAEVVRTMIQKDEMTITDDAYRDVQVGYFSKESMQLPVPLIFAYTVQDGVLGVHLNAGSAKVCIDSKLDGKDLVRSADFTAASAGLSAVDRAGLVFVRLSDLVPMIVRLSQIDFQRRGPDDAGAQRALKALAEVEKLGLQLRGIAGQRQAGASEMILEMSTPLGLMGGMSWIGAGMALDSIPPE